MSPSDKGTLLDGFFDGVVNNSFSNAARTDSLPGDGGCSTNGRLALALAIVSLRS
jgi:hypothetical protein